MYAATLLILVSLLAPAAAEGRVAPVGLDELFWDAEVVAIGRTTRVLESDGWKIAELEVDRFLKGERARKEVLFLADATWICDISDAEPGEHLLLFLDEVTAEPTDDSFFKRSGGRVPARVDGSPVYRISHSGRGRMPISRNIEGNVVRVIMDVVLSEAVRMLASDRSDYETWTFVPLGVIEAHLRSLPSKAPSLMPNAMKGPLQREVLRP